MVEVLMYGSLAAAGLLITGLTWAMVRRG